MTRNALVVGINAYSGNTGLRDLRLPAHDAEAVARILSEQGEFHITRLPEVKNPDVEKDNYQIRVGRGVNSKVSLKELRDKPRNITPVIVEQL